jgi:hypothetical protein
MRIASALLLGAGLLTGMLVDSPVSLSPVEAIQQVGRPKVQVELVVKSSKDRLAKRGIIYLDSEEDFANPANLGIAISAEAAEKFKRNGIADPAGHFKGKAIQVQGCVMRFEERPYLPVHDPSQIVILDAE